MPPDPGRTGRVRGRLSGMAHSSRQRLPKAAERASDGSKMLDGQPRRPEIEFKGPDPLALALVVSLQPPHGCP